MTSRRHHIGGIAPLVALLAILFTPHLSPANDGDPDIYEGEPYNDSSRETTNNVVPVIGIGSTAFQQHTLHSADDEDWGIVHTVGFATDGSPAEVFYSLQFENITGSDNGEMLVELYEEGSTEPVEEAQALFGPSDSFFWTAPAGAITTWHFRIYSENWQDSILYDVQFRHETGPNNGVIGELTTGGAELGIALPEESSRKQDESPPVRLDIYRTDTVNFQPPTDGEGNVLFENIVHSIDVTTQDPCTNCDSILFYNASRILLDGSFTDRCLLYLDPVPLPQNEATYYAIRVVYEDATEDMWNVLPIVIFNVPNPREPSVCEGVAATPTPTLSPTATPSPSPTPSPTATPTASPTATATSTPTVTPTATPTDTPSPTSTPEPTATMTETPTPEPTPTTTATSSPTLTPEPTATPTPSPTPETTPVETTSPTVTTTPSPTFAATSTPSPTATPHPVDLISVLLGHDPTNGDADLNQDGVIDAADIVHGIAPGTP